MERKEGKEVEGEVKAGEGVFAQLIWRIDSVQSQCKDVRLEEHTHTRPQCSVLCNLVRNTLQRKL